MRAVVKLGVLLVAAPAAVEPGGTTETVPGAPLCSEVFPRQGNRVFFSGFTPQRGAELWSFELP